MNDELETRVEQRTAELVQELGIRKQIESALRESEERYSLAILGANDGIWDWDLKSGHMFYSPRWKAMLGYGNEELDSSIDSWFNKVHPEDLGLLQVEISRHLDNTSAFFQFTHRLFQKDGNLIWVLCRGLAKRSDDGIAYRMSGSLTDITQQKLYEEQILHDAFHDNLTNLANRTFFLERVSHSILRAKRSERNNSPSFSWTLTVLKISTTVSDMPLVIKYSKLAQNGCMIVFVVLIQWPGWEAMNL